MNRLNLLLILFLLISGITFSQNENRTVAKIGEEEITAEEFKMRFELSPHIFPVDENSLDSLKYDFLYSLIAEKLWAKEAERMGLTENERFNFLFSPLEEMYVRDALFKKEIESNVSISAKDILNGIAKFHTTLNVKIVASNKKNKIDEAFKLLSTGIKSDSLSKIKNDLNISEKEINFGDLKNEELEDSLFRLLPGMITEPVNIDNGYAIFILTDKDKKVVEMNSDDIQKEVRKIIKNRRTERRYNQFFSDLFAGKTIDANDELFLKFAEEVLVSLKEQKEKIESEGGSPDKFYFGESEIYKVKNKLSSEILNQKLFEVEGNQVTLIEFLAFFTLNDFSVNSLEKEKVFGKLNNVLKTFIQLSFITNEGYNQNLQNSPEVKSQLEMWRSNYLSQFYKNQYIDSVTVTADEIYNYYLKSLNNNTGIKQIKVLEFRTDSLSLIETIFNRMVNGNEFREVINEIKSEQNVDVEIQESSFFPVTANEIGRIADKMKPGEVYGPVERFDKYEVFQLVDVKETSDSLMKHFESAKEGIKQELIFKEIMKKLAGATKKIIRNYNIEVNESVLQKINVSKTNMFVHRYMGFGGRIAAVPYTAPLLEWMDIKEILKEVLP